MSARRRSAAWLAVLLLLGAAAFGVISVRRSPWWAARERVKRMSAELERLRGKPFRRPVGVAMQSAEAFRAYVDREIDRELPPAKAAAVSKCLGALMLLPPGYALRKGLSDLYVSQAGAYYDPATQTFYVLMASIPDEQLDGLVLHELTHALQDQYHDLAAKTRAVQALDDDDALGAWQSVVEGEATLLMTTYELRKRGAAGMLDAATRAARDASRAALVAQVAGSAAAKDGAGEVARAMDALKTMPAYLFWALHAPYFRGQYAVHVVEQTGGWSAVDELLERPPASTEQIFHPEKLAGAREAPVRVELPVETLAAALGPGWRELDANVLGELGVFTLMAEKLPDRAGGIAAGWGGDRFAGFEDAASGAVAVIWRTVWDTEADAAEFRAGLEALGMRDDAVARAKEVLLLRGVPAEARERVLAALRG